APFYASMFNWVIHEGPIRFFAAGLGGPEPGPAGHLRASDRSGVTLYVQVRDLAESMARATSLGGAVTMEAFDVTGGPTLAGITDPEGNPITPVQQEASAEVAEDRSSVGRGIDRRSERRDRRGVRCVAGD